MQQIAVGKTLDVEVVEQELAALWHDTGEAQPDQHGDEVRADEMAVLRARAANLLVFIRDQKALEEIHELLPELTAAHPSRVLTMLGLNDAPDRDIEMYLSALPERKAGWCKAAMLRRGDADRAGKFCR